MRILHFTQVVDDRFDTDLENKIKNIEKEIRLKLEKYKGIFIETSNIYKVDFTDTKISNKQLRQDYYIKKSTREITWNDIYSIINSVKSVPYRFI